MPKVILSAAFVFSAGETIHTESSIKNALERFAGLSDATGWRVLAIKTDGERLFGVFLLEALA